MARAWMWGSVLGLAIGCGPGGGTGDGGSGTETETETDGSTGDASASASLSATQGSASATQGTASASATATATQGSASADDSGSANTSAGDSAQTSADEAEGSDGSCPPGGQGCPCDIGSTCGDGLECVEGVCVEPGLCEQPEGEPNDDEASAVVLEAATCGEPAAMIDAALFGMDVDWYIFETLGAQPFCFTNPTASVAIDGVDVEVCIFAVCPEGGQPNVSCGFMSGQTDAESPDGHLGCCDQGMAVLESAACDFGQTPPASVEVSVTGDTGDACIPYELSWGF